VVFSGKLIGKCLVIRGIKVCFVKVIIIILKKSMELSFVMTIVRIIKKHYN
jgi:hypothetical protein